MKTKNYKLNEESYLRLTSLLTCICDELNIKSNTVEKRYIKLREIWDKNQKTKANTEGDI